MAKEPDQRSGGLPVQSYVSGHLVGVTRTLVTQVPTFRPMALSVILVGSAACECFINETVHDARRLVEAGNRGIDQKLVTIAGLFSDIYLGQGSDQSINIRTKYRTVYRILTGTEMSVGSEPWQSFDDLLSARNEIMHLKAMIPQPLTAESDYDPTTATRLLRRLKRHGVVAPPDAHASLAPGEMIIADVVKGDPRLRPGWTPVLEKPYRSWIVSISNERCAYWAYRTVCAIIKSITNNLPSQCELMTVGTYIDEIGELP